LPQRVKQLTPPPRDGRVCRLPAVQPVSRGRVPGAVRAHTEAGRSGALCPRCRLTQASEVSDVIEFFWHFITAVLIAAVAGIATHLFLAAL
jgi:hypothetical protein